MQYLFVILGTWLAGVLVKAVEFLFKVATKKVLYTTLYIAGALTLFVGFFNLMEYCINTVLGTIDLPPGFTYVGYFLPSNTQTCIYFCFAGRILSFIYDFQRKLFDQKFAHGT